jgi:fumarylpyruvate hydrolase
MKTYGMIVADNGSDMFFTGTPSGVGPVKVGDRLVATIEGLPPLEVTVGPETV